MSKEVPEPDTTRRQMVNSALAFYMNLRGVTRRRGNGHVCVRRLGGRKRCADSINNPCFSPNDIPGADHAAEWVKDGQTYSITLEPYGIQHENLAKLIQWAESKCFKVNIFAESWHYPHRTILIEIVKA